MNPIFTSAKFKLTGLYLSIIMFVTLSFSFFIFSQVNQATEHALEIQRVRMERAIMSVPPQFRGGVVIDSYKTAALLEIRERTLYNLIVINIIIFLVSGALGYYLAEKTLFPIEEMIVKQKRFISDAAHEIKTPLTVMKADIEVSLRDKNLSLDAAKETLNRTLNEIDEMSFLTANLLNSSKYSNSNIYKKDIKEINLKELLAKVVRKFDSKAKVKNIELIEALENARLTADQKDIEQIAMNVLDNAIKYSNSDSKVYVTLKNNKKEIILKIKNYGIGIPEDQLNFIFDPFYRVDKSRAKSNMEGYGLGLAITKDIVESYGGKISATSKPNKETVFTIIFQA